MRNIQEGLKFCDLGIKGAIALCSSAKICGSNLYGLAEKHILQNITMSYNGVVHSPKTKQVFLLRAQPINLQSGESEIPVKIYIKDTKTLDAAFKGGRNQAKDKRT